MPDAASTPAPTICLRNVCADDLPTLFEFQLDPDANAMAALIPRSRDAFFEVWAGVIVDPNVVAKVIVLGDQVVGQISRFDAGGLPSIGYWIAKDYWGRGVASRALALLLAELAERPLHARVAAGNAASLRILLKHGFKITSRQFSPGDDRHLPCEEINLILR